MYNNLEITNNGTKLYVDSPPPNLPDLLKNTDLNAVIYVLNTTNWHVLHVFNFTASILIPTNSSSYIYTLGDLNGPNNLRQISIKNNTIVKSTILNFRYPYISSILLNPDSRFIYISDFYAGQGYYASSFDIINLSNGALIRNYSNMQGIIAIGPNQDIYITNFDKIAVINPKTNTIIANISYNVSDIEDMIIKSG